MPFWDSILALKKDNTQIGNKEASKFILLFGCLVFSCYKMFLWCDKV